jgi:ubiquinone/menaquinone biosynthesis C-methylase UbiE
VDHVDHVALLRDAVTPGGTWADIGAGTGAFTLALADLLGPEGRIVAVDRDGGAVHEARAAVTSRFPAIVIDSLTADFTRPLELSGLDGIVAANSLHFVPRDRQADVVTMLAGYLRPGGTFVVVEYDADHGNPWVPHPFRFHSWQRLADAGGLVEARRLGRVASRFLGGIYSAAARRPPGDQRPRR